MLIEFETQTKQEFQNKPQRISKNDFTHIGTRLEPFLMMSEAKIIELYNLVKSDPSVTFLLEFDKSSSHRFILPLIL
jgi:hypothetical protein